MRRRKPISFLWVNQMVTKRTFFWWKGENKTTRRKPIRLEVLRVPYDKNKQKTSDGMKVIINSWKKINKFSKNILLRGNDLFNF